MLLRGNYWAADYWASYYFRPAEDEDEVTIPSRVWKTSADRKVKSPTVDVIRNPVVDIIRIL